MRDNGWHQTLGKVPVPADTLQSAVEGGAIQQNQGEPQAVLPLDGEDLSQSLGGSVEVRSADEQRSGEILDSGRFGRWDYA